MLIVVILLVGVIFWREYQHRKFIKWIFLDWAWKFKTGEFEQGPLPETPNLKELMRRFLHSTKTSNKNAEARSKLWKSGTV